jgi:hypothetical protein
MFCWVSYPKKINYINKNTSYQSYSKFQIDKYLIHFLLRMVWQRCFAVSDFQVCFEDAIMQLQASQEGVKLSRTHQLQVHADDVTLLG